MSDNIKTESSEEFKNELRKRYRAEVERDEKTSFVMYTRYAASFELLSGDDTKKLMSAIFSYVKSGVEPDFNSNSMLAMAWAVVRADLDPDRNKWLDTKVERKVAGYFGGVAGRKQNKQS